MQNNRNSNFFIRRLCQHSPSSHGTRLARPASGECFRRFCHRHYLLVFVIPGSFTVFGEWARLSGVLVLYGTCRAHEKRMKSVVSPERAYWTVPSTALFSQGEWPGHRRVRPSLTIHFRSCKFKTGVIPGGLAGQFECQYLGPSSPHMSYSAGCTESPGYSVTHPIRPLLLPNRANDERLPTSALFANLTTCLFHSSPTTNDLLGLSHRPPD